MHPGHFGRAGRVVERAGHRLAHHIVATWRRGRRGRTIAALALLATVTAPAAWRTGAGVVDVWAEQRLAESVKTATPGSVDVDTFTVNGAGVTVTGQLTDAAHGTRAVNITFPLPNATVPTTLPVLVLDSGRVVPTAWTHPHPWLQAGRAAALAVMAAGTLLIAAGLAGAVVRRRRLTVATGATVTGLAAWVVCTAIGRGAGEIAGVPLRWLSAMQWLLTGVAITGAYVAGARTGPALYEELQAMQASPGSHPVVKTEVSESSGDADAANEST